MGSVVKFDKPYPKQQEFYRSTAKYTCYGGARGGGKSHAMRQKCEMLALNYPGIQILLLRRTLQELNENHVNVLQRKYYKSDVANYRDAKKELLFFNGSRIKLGYCDNEKDVLQYQGQAYEVICMEEATMFTEFQFQALSESNRLSGLCRKKFSPRMYFTCNPGGVGHAWVKRLFIDKEYRNSEKPNDYKFVAAKVYDNLYIMQNDPEYVRTLENLPEDRRKAMLDGNWDVYDGQYFREFDRDIHVVEPFAIPSHWRIYFTMDYGLDMLAAYWIAMDEKGNAFVFRELTGPDHIISEAAKLIREATNEKVYEYLAPPDLWNRRQEMGRSVADIFQEHGINLTKTSNDRIDGWMAMKEWLKVEDRKLEDGSIIRTSKMKIFSSCTYLIKCIPLLQFDEKRVNDVANQPHDITHGPDAIRGFCIHRNVSAKAPETPPVFNFEFEKPKKRPGGFGTKSRVI